jgi:hypothetical protein
MAEDMGPPPLEIRVSPGSLDQSRHRHLRYLGVFAPNRRLSPKRDYNPPPSTRADLKHLHATLGINRGGSSKLSA